MKVRNKDLLIWITNEAIGIWSSVTQSLLPLSPLDFGIVTFTCPISFNCTYVFSFVIGLFQINLTIEINSSYPLDFITTNFPFVRKNCRMLSGPFIKKQQAENGKLFS